MAGPPLSAQARPFVYGMLEPVESRHIGGPRVVLDGTMNDLKWLVCVERQQFIACSFLDPT